MTSKKATAVANSTNQEGFIANTFCIDSPVSNEAIEKAFRNGNFADFCFLFNEDGGQKRINAHTFILKATSDVFATMLNGDWKEQSEVEIVDASFDAFKEFLKFLYFPKVEISSKNLCELVYLADKYNIGKCMILCVQQIQNHLTSDNVCVSLGLALQYDLNELKEHCLDKISYDASEILETNGFLDCSKITLKTILAMDDLCCEEIELFDACLNWAKRACEKMKKNPSVMANVKNALGDCLYEIRFGVMTPKQIADCVRDNDGLFKLSEQKDLFLAIGSNQSEMKVFKNIVTRSTQWNDDEAFKCDLELKNNYQDEFGIFSKNELLSFQISKPLVFGGISIPNIKNNRAEISVTKIASNRQQTKILKQQFLLNGNGKELIYLKFIKPVRLQVNTKYRIRFQAENLFSYYNRPCIGPNQRKIFGDGVVLQTKYDFSNFIKSLAFNE